MKRHDHVLKISAYYGVKAPAIAYLGIMTVGTVVSIISGFGNASIDFWVSSVSIWVYTALFGIIVAYLVGFVPAFLTGVIIGLSDRPHLEVLLAGAVGAALSFAVALLTVLEIEGALALAVVGALSGMICATRRLKRSS